jgi:hypothetical protein
MPAAAGIWLELTLFFIIRHKGSVGAYYCYILNTGNKNYSLYVKQGKWDYKEGNRIINVTVESVSW